jgi:hypothetical protein
MLVPRVDGVIDEIYNYLALTRFAIGSDVQTCQGSGMSNACVATIQWELFR